MPRLSIPAPERVDPKAQRLLDAFEKSLGFVPNMMRVMSHAPAVLAGYAQLSSALAGGRLSEELREKIGLHIAEENQCEYCVSAHTAIAGGAGLSVESILDARRGAVVDTREQAALDFAKAVVDAKGLVADEDVARVRAAGYDDGAIAEIVANVVFTIYTNYFNNVAGTEVDFPPAPLLRGAAAA
jgi:uncharacterized peroxidase-related enzyme